MKEKIKFQKGFIQIPLLIAIIVSIIVVTTVIGYRKIPNPEMTITTTITTRSSVTTTLTTEGQQQIRAEQEKKLQNCLAEANDWYSEAEQSAIKLLEEEQERYNSYQEFIDEYGPKGMKLWLRS